MAKTINKPRIKKIRQLAPPQNRSTKSEVVRPKLPSAYKVFITSLKHLFAHRRLFIGIVVVYFLLSLVLVKGFSVANNLSTARDTLQSSNSGSATGFAGGLTLFGVLLSSSGSSSDTASFYQSFLIIIMSLVIIWALRQTYSNVSIKLKDPFYKGIYPLVPFMLVLLVIGIQTIPLLFANALYGIIYGNGVVVTGIEKAGGAVIVFMLSFLTLYFITSSLFALYVVSLPDVTPIQALRSARELVRHRRWEVMRKLLFLPIVLLLIGMIIFVPLILIVPVIAEWLYFFLSMATLVIVHGYMYNLYRELIA